MFVGMPETLLPATTSPGWSEPGEKLLLQGVVYAPDGRTSAAGVVIYYWQTDANGLYSPAPGMEPRARRHGHIRGWVKTGPDGKYAIRTIRPGSYPHSDIPAHIHLSIKEPTLPNEYYVDELVFDDDRALTPEKRKKLENRGGSGVLRPYSSGGMPVAEHDIILGLNIPNYPQSNTIGRPSGLSIGEDQPSFVPRHAYGPDKGSTACPVCKYGRRHGILYFVGNRPDWTDIRKWLAFLEQESVARGKNLKAYFVYGNADGYSHDARQEELERLGSELNLKHMALTFVPSLTDSNSEIGLSRLDPSASTIIVYRNRTIVDKFVDLKATTASFQEIRATLDRTKGAPVDPTEH
jgi:protocatechuate 3,4-dioxygenase beta subunit